jgi:hypothetical protein
MTGAVKNHGEVFQGFAPNRIVTAANSLDVSTVLAIRVGTIATYQIDGAGPIATLVAGSMTVIAPGINTFLFQASTIVEVMDE